MNVLKHFRKKKGLNQTELAHKINKSRFTVTNYETGASRIPESVAFQLGDLFECSPSLFMHGGIDMTEDLPPDDSTPLSRLQNFFLTFRLTKKT